MRLPLLAGNWKMYKTPSETREFLSALQGTLKESEGREVLVCPPSTSLSVAAYTLKGSSIQLGAQNMHYETEGAFTGEVSVQMLKDIGCTYVIIGHSERRQYFQETNSFLQKKLITAIQGGITPIYCVGETLDERKKGITQAVIQKQIQEGLPTLSELNLQKLVVAYEPVWAIGTGETATPEQAEEVHLFIRELLADRLGNTIADGIRILYGGSVKPDNIDQLMAKENIDGALVGGASLKVESFARIVNFSYNPARV